ncbi:MAG: tetratricopeptide repeat protein [Elusimicrobiaceae bacterium]|nr:tetratricopeptide repeat protein [Elusimicrobiaceae bacterium]
MCLNYKIIGAFSCLFLLTGCSSGFLGLAPVGDRKEYVEARKAYDMGDYPTAISSLSEYIYKTKNVNRREVRAYRLLGKSYEQSGQTSRALEVYSEALEFHPKNVPLLLQAAHLYQQNGLTMRSIELYDKALTQEPTNTTALAGQAANYTTLGFYSKARTFYDRFFELSEKITPDYRARYASTFLHQRNYEQAFIHITLALEQDSSNPDFWRLSAEARRGLNQPQAALLDLEAAVQLAPQRTDFLAYKALWLYEAEQYEDSVQTADLILQLQPNNELAQLIQALNWSKQGKTKAARKQLEQIAQQTPDSFVGQVSQKLLQ